MPLTYDEAVAKLHEWTQSPALLNHARAVEAVMREAARRYAGGQDEERWAMTGLLHDADYDQWPSEHPRRIVEWLRERGEPEMAHAISVHFTDWGIEPVSLLDRALLACDELAGFVVACCLVRPDGIATLSPSSVKKKLKDRSFAAKVDRTIIEQAIQRLGVGMDEHIRLVIDALAPQAAVLGIAGGGSSRQEGGAG
jgi:predicted hydrolase (HD superfamily)